jgi:hypothetical protein
MKYMIETILEKHAGVIDWYKKTKASPAFKAKRLAGKYMVGGALIGGPLLYGAHQLTKSPERIEPQQPQ